MTTGGPGTDGAPGRAARGAGEMEEYPRHIVAVMGVVRDHRGRLLLVRTERRGREPPGGQVERGEDLITALGREVAEESGCAVAVGRLIGVYSNIGGLGIVMFTFLCAHVVGEPRAGDECAEAGWFTPEEALGLDHAPGAGGEAAGRAGGGHDPRRRLSRLPHRPRARRGGGRALHAVRDARRAPLLMAGPAGCRPAMRRAVPPPARWPRVRRGA